MMFVIDANVFHSFAHFHYKYKNSTKFLRETYKLLEIENEVIEVEQIFFFETVI